MNKILVIEDDIKLQKYIKEYLSVYDFEVSIIEDFDDVIGQVQRFNPQIILLDINLPKFDGFYFLRLIRKNHKTPVIILSARSDEGEQIRGMELGADDYMTKPFSVGILLAKINAVLRRVNNDIESNDITCGKLVLFDESMKLQYEDTVLNLTKNEYKILKILLKNIGNVVSREDLLEALWDDTIFVDDNTLTVNITRVKKRLNELGLENMITTKRGVGYVFNKMCE